MKQFIFILVVAIYSGCSQQSSLSTNDQTFVDIHAFFESEIAELDAKQPLLFKQTKMDTLTNTDTVTNLKWSDELFPFLDIDIKPSVWKTDFAYVEPNHENEPNETAMVFNTTNPNQRVKQFKVLKDENGAVQRFSATIFDDGKISTSKTLISYTKGVGYSIYVDRETKLMGIESYRIVGQFINTTDIKE